MNHSTSSSSKENTSSSGRPKTASKSSVDSQKVKQMVDHNSWALPIIFISNPQNNFYRSTVQIEKKKWFAGLINACFDLLKTNTEHPTLGCYEERTNAIVKMVRELEE